MTERSDNLDDQKKIALYSAQVGAWIESKMEHDRTLITISAAGIGLLFTLMTTIGFSNCYQSVLYGLSLFLFLATIVICIIIYQRNTKFIEEIINGREEGDWVLSVLDSAANWTFVSALVLTFALGLVSIKQKEANIGGHVVDKKKSEKTELVTPDTSEKLSLNGIQNLKPSQKDSNVAPTSQDTSGKTGDTTKK